jgi:chondroitin-sulfate-ABC endolyase/exolyase
MVGTPEEGMNEIRIIAPDTKGKLYLDHIIPASKVDARQQTADVQVPFVNKGTTNHWLVIYEHSLWKPDIPLTAVSETQKQEMRKIEKRFRDMLYTPGRLSDKEMTAIRKQYDYYKITYKNGKVSGLPIFMVRQAEAYERMIPNWGIFYDVGLHSFCKCTVFAYFLFHGRYPLSSTTKSGFNTDERLFQPSGDWCC